MNSQNRQKDSNNDRMAWLLYSDVNNRFNIMIEECAHLQNTLFSYLDATYDHDFVFGKPKAQKEQRGDCESESSCHRNWWAGEHIHERECKRHPCKDADQIERIPPQQRSIINLIDFLGSLINGMTNNQENLQTHFLNYFQEGNNSTEKDYNFFWLMALRGEYINHAIQMYTDQIEHAHEKVVQLLENSPGFLPQPILLRRWNSAIQEEFLSRYTSQTNFEIAELLCGMQQGGKICTKEDTRNLWHNISVSHSWTHAGTSRFLEHQVQRPSKDATQNTTQHFVALRSAYFYLEQPVIFPLLYHECAHTWLSRSIDQIPDFPEINKSRFVKDLDEAVADLRTRGDFCWEGDIDFPKRLCEEAWADAISIVLGGRAYLAALAFQLFGQDGAYYFNSDWAQVPLEECGESLHRVKPLFLPGNLPGRYWWARLRLAHWLFQDMDKRLQTTDHQAGKDDSWITALDTCLNKWFETGEKVFSSELLGSTAFQEEWIRYQSLNEWIFAIWKRRITPHIANLAKIKKQQGDVYVLPEEVQEVIRETFKNYKNFYFSSLNGVDDNPTSPVKIGTILECTTSLRWEVSKLIINKLKDEKKAETLAESLAIFSNYIRNDGSVAFRIGLEWWLLIISVWDELHDACAIVEEPNHPKTNESDTIWNDVVNDIAALKDKTSGLIEKSPKKKEKLRKWIREKKFFFHDESPEFSEFSSALSAILVNSFVKFISSTSKVPVHTLTLGAMRFSGQKNNNGSNSYSEKLSGIRDSFYTRDKMLEDKIKTFISPANLGEERNCISKFYRLIGDYHFALLTPHTTPSERDIHCCNIPKMLVKPRVLWTVTTSTSQREPEADSPSMFLLVHYKHRWHWLKTAKELSKQLLPDACLYLSSGWEDVVLHLYDNEQKNILLNEPFLSALGVYGGANGVDCHTLIVYPQQTNQTSASKVTYPAFTYKSNVSPERIREVVEGNGEAYGCAGRYDYKITWKEPDDSQPGTITLQNYCNKWFNDVDKLSPLFPYIWSINTTMFKQVTKKSETDNQRFLVESTIMLNQN